MIEARADRGEPAKLLDDRPELLSQSAPFFEAFLELDGQRMLSGLGGATEIRREAVTDWLNENGVTSAADRGEYRRMVGALDRERLKIMAKRAEIKAPPTSRGR